MLNFISWRIFSFYFPAKINLLVVLEWWFQFKIFHSFVACEEFTQLQVVSIQLLSKMEV